MVTVHTISILKYLVEANLKHFVYNENGNPVVTCYAVIGQWLIRTETAQGGHPHAEVLCLSELGREKPNEVILSLSPCTEFNNTPPCCYSLLAFCSSLTIQELDMTQAESIRFLRCFISIGWMQSRSVALISSMGLMVDVNEEQHLLDPRIRLLTRNIYPNPSIFEVTKSGVIMKPNTDVSTKLRILSKKLNRDIRSGNVPIKLPVEIPLNSSLRKKVDKIHRSLIYSRMISRRLKRLMVGLAITNDMNFIGPTETKVDLFMTRIKPTIPLSRRINFNLWPRTNGLNTLLYKNIRPLTRRVFLWNQIIDC
ncbi:Riboflavin biosynthesis protein RibD [Candidatus Hodgkinia cicadicola]|nr:MAG: Riboflavin biosynthesis protein RibD [Candidatus Hodgkinia cicadicola]KON71446.1 MAG: Riboflavin biosynthesis protein RibD [Candidatus Hodgkinia cicadicola]PIM96692.1 Riboflavin biosynthesis protein RibD [Candidatus Hodgkinia cicadicola]PIM96694.1 Riboflavin biosynthesis protein RibD [Candidatus Hodgkinia cicadicola]